MNRSTLRLVGSSFRRVLGLRKTSHAATVAAAPAKSPSFALEDPEVIEKILRHLGLEEGERPAGEAPPWVIQ
jgi:hypothetical protein